MCVRAWHYACVHARECVYVCVRESMCGYFCVCVRVYASTSSTSVCNCWRWVHDQVHKPHLIRTKSCRWKSWDQARSESIPSIEKKLFLFFTCEMCAPKGLNHWKCSVLSCLCRCFILVVIWIAHTWTNTHKRAHMPWMHTHRDFEQWHTHKHDAYTPCSTQAVWGNTRGVTWVEQRAIRLLKDLVRVLYWILKHGTCRLFVENKSIQVLDSFYINSLKLKRSIRWPHSI